MSDSYAHSRAPATTPSVTVLSSDTETTAQRASKLDAQHFHFYYGAFQALRDITLSMAERSITAIIGPSGCGKSTFLRAINRMHDQTPGARAEGAILFDGRNVYDPNTDAVLLRRRIGMVFQRPNVFAKPIFDNVAYGLRVAGWRDRAKIAERVEQALRQSALWDEVKDQLHSSALGLSGGQQQRLCIARTIAVRPEVLLLDEATSALDPISTARARAMHRRCCCPPDKLLPPLSRESFTSSQSAACLRLRRTFASSVSASRSPFRRRPAATLS